MIAVKGAPSQRPTMAGMEARTEAPAVPRRVCVEITARCDLACLHCAGAMRERRRGDMDYAFFRRVVALLRRVGVHEIVLGHLGEPFLCRWLPEAVAYAKHELGFPVVSLVTNGRVATPERVRDCLEAGLDRLEFSYNYAGPEQFHYITGAREQDFWKVEVNLMAARLMRDDVEAHTGQRCALVASSLRVDAEQPRRMQRALARIRTSADSHVWRPLAGPICGRRGTERRPCRALFEQAHITYDGKLSACPYEHDAGFVMGDLACETFLEAWTGDRFARLREAHGAGRLAGTPCEGCEG